jgi:hypothetical protein
MQPILRGGRSAMSGGLGTQGQHPVGAFFRSLLRPPGAARVERDISLERTNIGR